MMAYFRSNASTADFAAREYAAARRHRYLRLPRGQYFGCCRAFISLVTSITDDIFCTSLRAESTGLRREPQPCHAFSWHAHARCLMRSALPAARLMARAAVISAYDALIGSANAILSLVDGYMPTVRRWPPSPSSPYWKMPLDKHGSAASLRLRQYHRCC